MSDRIRYAAEWTTRPFSLDDDGEDPASIPTEYRAGFRTKEAAAMYAAARHPHRGWGFVHTEERATFDGAIFWDNAKTEDADEIAREAFERHAEAFGFQPSDFRRPFDWGEEILSVYGFNPRARRYPVIAADVRGRLYAFPAAEVLDSIRAGCLEWPPRR